VTIRGFRIEFELSGRAPGDWRLATAAAGCGAIVPSWMTLPSGSDNLERGV